MDRRCHELRPDLRYEQSLEADAYSNPAATPGTGKHYQFMLAADLIFDF